jgi:hypothetical protein
MFAASKVAPELPLLLLLPLLAATVLELPAPATTELPELEVTEDEAADAAVVLLAAMALLTVVEAWPDDPWPPPRPPPDPKCPPRAWAYQPSRT